MSQAQKGSNFVTCSLFWEDTHFPHCLLLPLSCEMGHVPGAGKPPPLEALGCKRSLTSARKKLTGRGFRGDQEPGRGSQGSLGPELQG